MGELREVSRDYNSLDFVAHKPDYVHLGRPGTYAEINNPHRDLRVSRHDPHPWFIFLQIETDYAENIILGSPAPCNKKLFEPEFESSDSNMH